ncbi:MAG: hypothetical protein GOP50_07155 [Candidatus Heimdallarchaeota archaeon]|nr:hypothetical protein [Candidatus Heimdallarchaeota archaeon]
MDNEWRLLNVGQMDWLDTQAIYHALALVQNELQTPNTLILTWPDQPLVCVGLHQVLEKSVEMKYIEDHNLPLVRRGTGGGSVYLDSNQIFYQIICRKRDYSQNLRNFYEYFLTPTVATYNEYDIPAKYSPINDIVANGRKVSGNGAVSYEESRVLVGNFIFSFPSKEMSKILKVPDEKFRDKIANSLEERMGSFDFFLDELPSKEEVVKKYVNNFQEILNIELVEGSLLKEEEDKLIEIKELYQQKDWLYYVEKDKDDLFQQKIKGDTYFAFSEKKFSGGLVQLFVHFDESKITDIVISGDFSLSPPFVLEEIQEKLINAEVDEIVISEKLNDIFNFKNIDLPGISPEEIANLIVETFSKIRK